MVGRNIMAAGPGRRKLLTSWWTGSKEEQQEAARTNISFTGTSPSGTLPPTRTHLPRPTPIANNLSKCSIHPLGMSPQDTVVSSNTCTDTHGVCATQLPSVSSPAEWVIMTNHHQPLTDYNVPCSLWICVEGSGHGCVLFYNAIILEVRCKLSCFSSVAEEHF